MYRRKVTPEPLDLLSLWGRGGDPFSTFCLFRSAISDIMWCLTAVQYFQQRTKLSTDIRLEDLLRESGRVRNRAELELHCTPFGAAGEGEISIT